MNNLIWLDGSLVPTEKATIPIMSHTLHYGTGAFEGIRVYKTTQGRALLKLDEHIKRLIDSFSIFEAPLPWKFNQIKQAVIDTVRANDIDQGYVRPIIFFGSESLHIDPRTCSVHMAIIVVPFSTFKTKAITVMTSPIKRICPQSFDVAKKINGHYINSVHAHQNARLHGYDEALLLDHNGYVAECSIANIFMVDKQGIVKTPALGSILPGITRAIVLELANRLGLQAQEKSITYNNLVNAAELFITGTAAEIMPISKLDNQPFIPSEVNITSQLQKQFHKIVHERHKEFQHWFTYIDSQ